MNINGKFYSESEAAAYIQQLLRLLADARSLLSYAFYADYKNQNKSDNVAARIDYVLRSEKK